jgi:hypothetical protein
MSHITCQSERDENAAIHACPYANVQKRQWVEHEIYEGGFYEYYIENECGETKYLGAAKDQCIRCGKIFTY